MEAAMVFSIEQARRLPGVLLWHASKLWQQRLHTALAPLQLSSTNGIILCNVLHLTLEGLPATQVAVAGLSGVDVMTASQSIRVLERKGFLVRSVSKHDKRARVLELTARGRQTAQEALAIIARSHQQFFAATAIGQPLSLADHLQQLITSNKEGEKNE